jgi:hypothetical protein
MLLTSIHWILSAGCYAELQPSSQHPPVLRDTHTNTRQPPYSGPAELTLQFSLENKLLKYGAMHMCTVFWWSHS